MSNDWIDISPKPLDHAAVVSAVRNHSAGGIDVFLGTTRSEVRADGVLLAALDYEAYHEMALTQIRTLVADARSHWPIARVAVLHRIGRVNVGEASVVIAVSCPHRADAFDACRFLIDELKKSVTIWKREVWADQSSSWVAGTQPT